MTLNGGEVLKSGAAVCIGNRDSIGLKHEELDKVGRQDCIMVGG